MSSETTPPFRFWRFFFSLQGRVSQKAIWFFVLPVQGTLLAGQYGITLIKSYWLTAEQLFQPGWLYANAWVGLVMIIMLWPSFAVVVKRLHDLGRRGMFAIPLLLPFVLALAVGISTTFLVSRGEMANLRSWEHGFGLARNLVDLYDLCLIIFLALRRGERGPNRFGADPTGYAADAVF